MAAFRNGIKTVIIPSDNGKDLEEIDQMVRNALQFILVERADQVLSAALNPPTEVVELSQTLSKGDVLDISTPIQEESVSRPQP